METEGKREQKEERRGKKKENFRSEKRKEKKRRKGNLVENRSFWTSSLFFSFFSSNFSLIFSRFSLYSLAFFILLFTPSRPAFNYVQDEEEVNFIYHPRDEPVSSLSHSLLSHWFGHHHFYALSWSKRWAREWWKNGGWEREWLSLFCSPFVDERNKNHYLAKSEKIQFFIEK